MKYKIRKANQHDFHHIQSLNSQLFLEARKDNHDDILDTQWSFTDEARTFFTEIFQKPEYICLLAEDENKQPVGYIIGSSKRKFGWRTKHVGELIEMYVLESWRRNGVGKKLVAELCTRMEQVGVERIYVIAYQKNEPALTFYQDLHFSPLAVSFEKDLS